MNKIIILTIVLLVSSSALAQRKKITVSKQPAKNIQYLPIQPDFLTKEFDESVEQLPSKFLGHDIVKLFNTLKTLPLRKSEFESSLQYSERLNQISNIRLFGSLIFDSTFAFTYTANERVSSDSLKANYDADRQVLSVSINSDFGSLKSNLFNEQYSFGDLQSLSIFQSVPRNLGSYIGVNGYGTRVKIQRGEFDQYEVIFPNCVGTTSSDSYSYERERKTSLSTREVVVDVNVPSLEAIDLKYNLGILIIGKLTSPFFQSDKVILTKPTIKSPTDIQFQKHSLVLDVKSMWIYSRATGKVYKKIPKCSLKPPASQYDRLRDRYHYFF